MNSLPAVSHATFEPYQKTVITLVEYQKQKEQNEMKFLVDQGNSLRFGTSTIYIYSYNGTQISQASGTIVGTLSSISDSFEKIHLSFDLMGVITNFFSNNS